MTLRPVKIISKNDNGLAQFTNGISQIGSDVQVLAIGYDCSPACTSRQCKPFPYPGYPTWQRSTHGQSHEWEGFSTLAPEMNVAGRR